MRSLLITLLITLSFSCHAAGQNFTRITDERLQGNQLVSKTDNFAMTAPDKTWQWHEFKRSRLSYGYLVINSENSEKYLLTINNKKYPPVHDKLVQVYLENIVKRHAAVGTKITKQKYRPSKSPIKNSYHISYKKQTESGKAITTHSYLFTNKKLYMISYSTEKATPDKEDRFKQFVATFKPLK